MSIVRTSFVDIYYRGFNITADIAKDLISFSYTDNEPKKADKITLTLQDSKRKWLNNWRPEKGDTIQAAIVTNNWRYVGDTQRLECGTFKVDAVNHSGWPTTVQIEAVSLDPLSSFRSNAKHRTWTEILLSDLAGQIAVANGFTLYFDSTIDPFVTKDEQANQSDSNYLAKLASRYGLSMKTNNSQIVMYSTEDYDNKNAVIDFDINDMLSFEVEDAAVDTYDGVRVVYYNPKTQNKIDYTFKPGDKKKVKRINTPVFSEREAEQIARAEYVRINKGEILLQFTVPGNVLAAVGVNANITGFAQRDGKYSIEKVDHSLAPYTTKIVMKRTVSI